MPHIVPSLELKDRQNELWNMMQRLYQQLARVINGGISFGNGTQTDNISGAWANISFPTANVDVTIMHNLGRVPAGWLLVSKNIACDLFLGTKVPTTTTLTLQSSAVGAVVARIFIF